MGKDVSTLALKAAMIYNSRKKCRKVRYGLKKSTKGRVFPLKVSSSDSKCPNLAKFIIFRTTAKKFRSETGPNKRLLAPLRQFEINEIGIHTFGRCFKDR